jgi:molybdopterin-guanine dinucleotide biosynthesis protein A
VIPQQDAWTAAILAGGAARRFGGRDKSALVVDGRTILDRQIELLGTLTDDVLVVGGPPTRAVGPARAVADRVRGCGPLGGLDAALAAARGAATLVVACDMPSLTAPLLRYLLACADSADAVVPRTERGYHPLCAVYTAACRAAVADRLAARRLAMTGLFDALRLRVVAADELARFGDPDRLLANVNTPDDFRTLEALQEHHT